MNLSIEKQQSSACKCSLCSFLKCDDSTTSPSGTKFYTGNSQRGVRKTATQTITKSENGLCTNYLRPKVNCVFTETSQNCMNTVGTTFHSDEHISKLDQMNNKHYVTYSSLSKCFHIESNGDMYAFSHVDLKINYPTATYHTTSFESNGTKKRVSVFSKDWVDSYFWSEEQLCKDSASINGIQGVRCSRNPGDLHRVCGENPALQTLTAFGETVEQRNREKYDSVDNLGLKRSKIINKFEAVEKKSDVDAGVCGKGNDLLKNKAITKDDEPYTTKDVIKFISFDNNIEMVSDTLLKDDNKIDKAICCKDDVWVRMDNKKEQNYESFTPRGTEENFTEKEMEKVTFENERCADGTGRNVEGSPIDENTERKEKRNKNEKVLERQAMLSEKWKTTKMPWKPSDNDLDKEFFITFPGIAFNINDTEVKFHEDWRDAVLNNYVLRHFELNSILTVRTFEDFLQSLVEKRLMVRTKKGLRTIGSRRQKEKKKKKKGQKYQIKETENKGAQNDDLTELFLDKNDLQGGDHCKTDRKRRRRSRNIFLGYICMRIIRRLSKNVLIL